MSPAKAPPQEAIKQEKDGLAVWDDIARYAQIGHEAITDGDYERLKWYGVYQQRPKGGGLFMMRIKIPAGRLPAASFRAIGELAQKYGRNLADITTRQDIQLHWLTIQDMPAILDVIYNQLGLYQNFSCGDAPRNLTSCPLAGVDAEEIADASELGPAISHMYKDAGSEFSNLPRKFKPAVAGCAHHCHLPQINCLGLFGARRVKDGVEQAGYGLMVGGGLRNTPHMGQSLRVFLPADDHELIKKVCWQVAAIFRDAPDLRLNRLKARLKFHVAKVGWEAFRDELEERLGFELEHDDSIVFPTDLRNTDHMGVGRQKDGRAYVGVPTPRGRMTGEDLMKLADLAEKYAKDSPGRLTTTVKQNIILMDIDPDRVDALCKELEAISFPPKAHPFRTNLLSCTGIEFCNLAVVETKQRAKEILDYLSEAVDLDETISIHISGCPNACAQYQIADIGLSGTVVKIDKEPVEAYHVYLGGHLGENPAFATEMAEEEGSKKKVKVPSSEIHAALERVIKAYLAEREPEEPFYGWSGRQPMARLAGLLLNSAS